MSVDFDGALVFFDDGMCNRKTQSGAFGMRFGRKVGLKDLSFDFRLDSRPIVRDTELPGIAGG